MADTFQAYEADEGPGHKTRSLHYKYLQNPLLTTLYVQFATNLVSIAFLFPKMTASEEIYNFLH